MQNDYSPYTPYPPTRQRVPVRISRTTYFLRWVLLGLAVAVAASLMGAAGHASRLLGIVLVGLALGVLLNVVVALFCSIIIPRVRDVGLHPAWSLLVFFHSVGTLFLLALLFIPTDTFARRSARAAYYY